MGLAAEVDFPRTGSRWRPLAVIEGKNRLLQNRRSIHMRMAEGENSASKIPSKEEKDVFRDTPVRYLGYANEVGEAFRAQVHVNWVRLR